MMSRSKPIPAVESLEARTLFSDTPAAPHVTGPTATMSGSYRPYRPGDAIALSIDVKDDVAIDPATLHDGDDFVAIAPDGRELPVTWGHVPSEMPYGSGGICACMSSVEIIQPMIPLSYYGVSPPGGSWDAADTGTYIVRMVPGGVRDAAGNPSLGADVGTFRIAVGDKWTNGYEEGHDLVAWLDDFTPPAPTTPTTRKRATPVAATLIVSNTGDLPAKGPSSITVSLVSQAADGTSASREILVRNQRIKLAPDGSRRIRLRLKLPQDVADGEYRLVAHVGPLNGLARVEPNDANNTIATTPFTLTRKTLARTGR